MQCVTACCNVLQRVAVCCSAEHLYRPITSTLCKCRSVHIYQHVALCCHVLQYVALCYGVLQCVALCCRVLQSVAVCCSALYLRCLITSALCKCHSLHIRQRVAVSCCSILQCFTVCGSVLHCVALCCSVLQYLAVCCSVLQCVAVCRSMLHLCCLITSALCKCCSVQIRCGNTQKSQNVRRAVARYGTWWEKKFGSSQCVALCCSVLQCVAGRCSVL